jgi:hypothetical protein
MGKMKELRVRAVLVLARLFGVPVQVHNRYFMSQPLK